MPYERGEIQITMPVRLSNSPVRRSASSSYTSRLCSRSTSLDRCSTRNAYSSSGYRSEYIPSHWTSGPTVTSRPPKPFLPSTLEPKVRSYASSAKELGFTCLSPRITFEVSPPARSLPSMSVNNRRSADAIIDCSSPILTKYRDLGESRSSSDSGYRSWSCQTSPKCLSSSMKGQRSDSSSNLSESSSSSSSSSPKFTSRSHIPGYSSIHRSSFSPVDETHKYCSRPSQYDSNHNVYSSPRHTSVLSLNSQATSLTARSWQAESSTSADSSSSSEYSPSPHRSRKCSAIVEETSCNDIHRRLSRNNLEKTRPAGLRNLGNTCFMNSVLQCLSHTVPLLEYCLKNDYCTDINTTNSSMKGALIKAFAVLMQTMWKSCGESVLSPQAFRSQIQRFAPRFMGYSQQDAQEFLRYLLQGLHEDVNSVVTKPLSLTSDIDDSLSDTQKASESWRRYLRFDNSVIVDIFVGQLKSTLHCTSCGHDSVTFDPFWDLSLPIPKSLGQVSLLQCINLFTKEEVLDGDEKPVCSKCKSRRKCIKSFSIHKFPKILVLHLKRFSQSERFRAKLHTTVNFPLDNLDLSSYASVCNKGRSILYNLYAVSNHSGSTYSGHYTSICRHPYTTDWHDFNDGRVSPIKIQDIVTSDAYVLFYELTRQTSRL